MSIQIRVGGNVNEFKISQTTGPIGPRASTFQVIYLLFI